MSNPESQPSVPLVSVIIRSMDRQALGEALAAVARQTCDNVEVVLVNAKGGMHGEAGGHCGRFPLRLVNQGGAPLSRPQAANAGLDAAAGRYLAFLDDDDTLDPDHLCVLVAVMQAHADVVVAYAGVRCMERGDGERRISRIFGAPLESTAQLLAGNFIPVHAPLFPRGLLQCARYDEALETYEDWDFWLQLAQHARFVYSNRVTATYFTGGTSGVSPQAPDLEAVRRATRVLFAKWMRLTPDDFKKICDLYHNASAEVQKSHAEIGSLQQQLREVRLSTSWRITGPLRWLKGCVSKLFGRS